MKSAAHRANTGDQPRRRGSRHLGLAVLTLLLVSACTPGGGGAGAPSATPPTSSSGPPASQPATAEPTATAGARLSWGPSTQHYDDAVAAVADMTTEELAGQVMVGFYAGTDPASQEQAIRDLHLAGSIVMGDNVPLTADGAVDPVAMTAVTRGFTEAVAADGRTWPAVVSVDQEGGQVARLGSPLTSWPTPMTYGAAADPALLETSMTAMNSELAGLGFTMNHAPSVDVTTGADDPTIGARAYSDDPELVAELGPAAVTGMLASGILPSVKHFPGHGSVPADSHLELPVQTASLTELEDRDWAPFRAAAEAGVPVMMMGHIAVEALDPGVPSSVSAPNYDALRDLGFEGVVVTDALNMAAVEQLYPGGQAAARALAAGADLLLMPTDAYAAHAGIVAAIQDGTLPSERLAEAATRVVTLMMWQAELADDAETASPGEHGPASEAASAAGITVLTGACEGDLLNGTASIIGGTAADVERFTAAAADRGVIVGAGGTTVALVGPDGAGAAADIAVALDAPWSLDAVDAPVEIAAYSNTPGAFAAVLDVLTGAAAAPGRLPVATAGYDAGTGC
ncbi:glycoside hydrolase family 3 N-terminal domain-containing protein [Arthrobacter sp. CAN_C5]|uniref:glycoside hydrolase family 3 protein n=1 Tax=Arthrobacter sp. CAN_C5 TaxID=2760706 RepID=UPI0028AAE153|nr:glycoside hydrolase family 3 N-terminal domain-containing protein [Arthrobacter sp. CAN_C5]MBP2215758.1 beta-N-acetylhexosaminidase [Arthrobacter sp. CAN_C5]